MKKTVATGLVVLTLCIGFTACEQTKSKKDGTEVAEEQNAEKMVTDEGEDDAEFMVKAASGGMLEVELGQLATQKGGNTQVKEFGRQMIKDHGTANQELKNLATLKNITLPTSMSDKHRKHVEELSRLSGAEFDREYMELMKKDHKEDIKLFEKAANEAMDADIKALAAKELPVLRHHLQMAEQGETMSGNHADHTQVNSSQDKTSKK